MYKYSFLTLLVIFPVVTHAQSLQVFLANFIGFLNTVVIPFLLGIGFLFFAINAIRYFVLGGAQEQGREKAKNLAIYSIAAFVVILIFWGVVNLIGQSIGLSGVDQPTPDYLDPDSVRNSGIPQGSGSGGNTNAPVQFNPPLPGNSGPANNGGGPCANGGTFDANGQPCSNNGPGNQAPFVPF